MVVATLILDGETLADVQGRSCSIGLVFKKRWKHEMVKMWPPHVELTSSLAFRILRWWFYKLYRNCRRFIGSGCIYFPFRDFYCFTALSSSLYWALHVVWLFQSTLWKSGYISYDVFLGHSDFLCALKRAFLKRHIVFRRMFLLCELRLFFLILHIHYLYSMRYGLK